MNYTTDVEERAPRDKTRLSSVEVTRMHLTHQDLAESIQMLKEVTLSRKVILFNNSGMAGEVSEDRRAASMTIVLERRKKAKKPLSLISMLWKIVEEISK